MAFTFRGFDGTASQLNEEYWSRLQYVVGELRSSHGVLSGLGVTPGAGTRQLSVSAGEGALPGVYFSSDATETVTVAANSSGVNRLDYLVLRGNWANSPDLLGVPGNSVALVVRGGSASLPALTQTPGVTWEEPLARITVRPGVTAFLTTDIEGCAPIPRVNQKFHGSVAAGQSMAAGAAAKTIATLTVPDPGWPFYLKVTARVRFNPSTGFAVLTARANGSEINSAYSTELDQGGGAHTTWLICASAVRTGATDVVLQMATSLMNGGDTLVVNNTPNMFVVEQIPA